TLVLGWSLNYEIYFYTMFAAALAVAPRWAPATCAIAIVTVAIAIGVSGSAHPTIQFYARPLVFEFVYGIGVFYLVSAADRAREWCARRMRLRAGLWAAAMAAVAALALEEFHGGFGLPRFIAAGVPAAVLVLACLLLERMYAVRTTSSAVFMLGESS